MKENNKSRLFELMYGKKPILNEANVFQQAATAVQNKANSTQAATRQKAINNQLKPDFRLETYGDLQDIVNVIQKTKRGEIIGAKIAGSALDSFMPFISVAKNAGDIFKAMSQLPDDKKTNSWLDFLNIDDDLSAIVDDKIENAFLNQYAETINNKPREEKLPLNFDINAELNKFIAANYNQKSVANVPKNLVNLQKH